MNRKGLKKAKAVPYTWATKDTQATQDQQSVQGDQAKTTTENPHTNSWNNGWPGSPKANTVQGQQHTRILKRLDAKGSETENLGK
ncbi:hypothetical protein MMC34_007987 [Xylographa carneopallida]|nr:hypothetical protein [Xylographa carneopallida]